MTENEAPTLTPPKAENLDQTHLAAPIISVRKLARHFGTETALKDASFDIHEGEFMAIVGPSGSGKSTLLNLLGLLDTPTSGSYLMNGRAIEDFDGKELDGLRSRTFGFVFQNSYVFPSDPAYLNAALGLRIQGVEFSQRHFMVAEAMASLGLSDALTKTGSALSGGERQRLAIARAVVTQPRIIFADEPTGNLDSANTVVVIEELRRLTRTGITVVVITHDEDVAAAADRRIHLSDGVAREEVSSNQPGEIEIREPSSRSRVKRQRPSFRHRMVSVLDNIADALNALTVRPARTLLLLFAFLLGTGGLVAGAGLTETASNQVAETLNQAALDEVRFVDSSKPSGQVPTHADLALVYDSVGKLDGVVDIGVNAQIASSDAVITRLSTVHTPKSQTYTGSIELADFGFMRLIGARTDPTHAPELMSLGTNIPAAIVGSHVAEELGIAQAAPGVIIWVKGKPVPVVGILHESSRNPVSDRTIFINLEAARNLSNVNSQFVVRTLAGYPPPLKDAIPKVLSPGSPASISTETVADLRSLRIGVGNELGTMIGVVSIVMLILASLTAATAMYLSVQARIPEIALRRALGMRKSTVAAIFMAEGTLIGCAGGLAGALFGLLTVVGVSAFQSWTPVLSPLLPVAGLAAGILTGAIASLYPALIAAKADPAQALRL